MTVQPPLADGEQDRDMVELRTLGLAPDSYLRKLRLHGMEQVGEGRKDEWWWLWWGRDRLTEIHKDRESESYLYTPGILG